MNYALYVVAGLEAVAGIYSVAIVGKPRKPVKGRDAATALVIDAATVVVLVLAAMRW